jgi:hypothetical protein
MPSGRPSHSASLKRRDAAECSGESGRVSTAVKLAVGRLELDGLGGMQYEAVGARAVYTQLGTNPLIGTRQ